MNTSDISSPSDTTGVKRKLHDALCSPNSKTLKLSQPFYVKLAPESPQPSSEGPSEEYYDSANERETDVVQDSDDYSSSDSAEDETEQQNSHIIESFGQQFAVIEYEVNTDSDSDSSFLFSESSSGTEGPMDSMFFGASKFEVDIDSSSSKEFPILANTTDDFSTDSSDRELTKADRWKCVRCKNEQNSPMYRYCEKCYKLRKSLFPPRPKCRKKGKRTSSSQPERSLSSIKRKHQSNNHSKNTSLSSGSDTSSNEDDDHGSSKKAKTAATGDNKPSYPTNSCSKILKRKSDDEVESLNPAKRTLKEVDSGHGTCSSQEQACSEESQETFVADLSEKEPEADLEIGALTKQHSIGSATTEPIHSGDEDDWLSSDAGYENDGDDTLVEDGIRLQRRDANSMVRVDSGLSQTSEIGLCAICQVEEKNAAFVHSRFVHFAACYRCAVKSWSANKNCPICFGKVSNVVKVFVQ